MSRRARRNLRETVRIAMMYKRDAAAEAAWKYLDEAVVGYKGKPVGTVAALDTDKATVLFFENEPFSVDCSSEDRR